MDKVKPIAMAHGSIRQLFARGGTVDRDKRIEEIRQRVNMLKTTGNTLVLSIEKAEFLLEEMDRLQKERDDFKHSYIMLQKEFKQIQQERDKLIEGIMWYADEENYTRTETEYHQGYAQEIMWDRGIKARSILKEVGVTDV